ncbi:peroxiredoxin family protein [Rhabdothermincola sediminis]|uniref:peroxiredoxin family protein n=1 Tax=Rhabdothermincola sediminis TaxID=2751370 RepID=UPI0027DA5FF8|nr:redoxin domain-containing protein [Rhabdothermincola sediminis]
MNERDGAQAPGAAVRPRRGLRWVWPAGFVVVFLVGTALVWQRRPVESQVVAPPARAGTVASTEMAPATRGPAAGEGEPAPAFVVADLTGAPVELSALRGEAVAVYFLATNACASCEAGARKLAVALDTVGADNAEVVAVDYDPADSAESLTGFAQSVGSPPFRWVLDTNTTMAQAFEPATLSEVVIIDSDGIIVARGDANATDQATLTGWLQQAAT